MVITLLDFDQIKSFIYAAPMLRAIRGGSSILAEFNNSERVEKRVQDKGGLLIYAGGGSVLAQFDAREHAEEYIENEKKELARITGNGATFTDVIEETNGQRNPGQAVLQAQRRLLRSKAQRGSAEQFSHHFLLKPCEACASRPAVTQDDFKGLLVCVTCQERIKRGGDGRSNRQQLLNSFLAEAGAAWKAVEEAADLVTLAAASGNYIGLIQADGNAMGQRLKRLAEISATDMTLFTEFSAQCRKATEEALLRVLRDVYPAPSRFERQTLIPFELVVVGGDDITLITTADRAIQVAIEFCDRFTESMESWAKAQGKRELAVGMSAGVAFARSSYPIVLLDELAGQLLKSAKARSRRESEDSLTPTIDFMAIRGSTCSDLKTIRKQVYARTEERLTQRPYTTCELRRLIGALQYMKHPPGGIQPFPRNKLHDLYQIPFQSYEQAKLNYRVFRGRLGRFDWTEPKTCSHRDMLRKLAEAGGMITATDEGPWRHRDCSARETPLEEPSNDTNLLDAVELYDFVPRPVTSSV